MDVKIIEPFGYCAGVRQAINIAIEAREMAKDRKICVLGMLVHNEDALETLKKHNISTIYQKDKDLCDLIDLLPQNALVILTAHGHSKQVEEKLKQKRIDYIDATCPFVNLSHSVISKYITLGYEVFYIGKEGHPEANAALSISDKIKLVTLDQKEIPEVESKALVISQTTFSRYDIEPIVERIKEMNKGKIITVKENVCFASTQRQESLMNLSKEYELIYVVGGANSNNTKTLARLAEVTHKNAKVIMIQNELDIKEKDLKGLNHIAISSGASTPSEVILAIKAKIESLCN